jgi:hypothetical protein
MTTSPLALPSGHLLLTPDIITAEFLAYLESAGIPDPGDDLDFVIITDADRLARDLDAMLSTGSNGLNDRTDYWMLPWDDQLSRSINQSFFVDWYKIEFADGLKAVGICSH